MEFEERYFREELDYLRQLSKLLATEKPHLARFLAKRQSPRRLLINCQNSYSNIIKMGYVLAEYAAKARVVMHKTK